jgi:hypothetical protein
MKRRCARSPRPSAAVAPPPLRHLAPTRLRPPPPAGGISGRPASPRRSRSNTDRRQGVGIGDANESEPGADDARQRRSGPSEVDHLVSGILPSGRTRPGRNGGAFTRRDYRAGLGGEACAWPVGAAAAESINGGFPRCTRHASPGDAHRDHRRGQCRGSCC